MANYIKYVLLFLATLVLTTTAKSVIFHDELIKPNGHYYNFLSNQYGQVYIKVDIIAKFSNITICLCEADPISISLNKLAAIKRTCECKDEYSGVYSSFVLTRNITNFLSKDLLFIIKNNNKHRIVLINGEVKFNMFSTNKNSYRLSERNVFSLVVVIIILTLMIIVVKKILRYLRFIDN